MQKETIGWMKETEYSDISEESEVEEELHANEENFCCACLNPPTTTRIFLPCGHAIFLHVQQRNSGH